MMQLWRRIWHKKGGLLVAGVVLALILPLAVAACQPPPEAEQEVSAVGKIKIGITGPMKFVIGQEFWKGAEIAADEINQAGGILVNGKKYNIELVKVDTNELVSIPDATSAIDRAITVNNVDFLIGGYRSEAVLAQQEIMAREKIVWISSATSHPQQILRVGENYDKYKYYFRCGGKNSFQIAWSVFTPAELAIRAVREELGVDIPRVAVIADKAIWTELIVEAAPSAISQLGGEFVGSWLPSMTATSVKGELTGIKNANAHIAVDLLASAAGVALSKEWGELQIPVVVAGVNSEASRKAHWEATSGGCNYELVYQVMGRAALTESTIPFYDEYLERYGDLAQYDAMSTYDAIYILKQAVERADTFVDSDAVVVELEKTDFNGTRGRVVFYPKGHEWTHDAMTGPDHIIYMAGQWRDGELKAIWPDGKRCEAWTGPGGPSAWEGITFPGTVDYVVPPWVKEYWKGKS